MVNRSITQIKNKKLKTKTKTKTRIKILKIVTKAMAMTMMKKGLSKSRLTTMIDKREH